MVQRVPQAAIPAPKPAYQPTVSQQSFKAPSSQANNEYANTRESALVENATSAGGIRAVLSRMEIIQFIKNASSLDLNLVAFLLNEKLNSQHWQSKLKALCIIEVMIQRNLPSFLTASSLSPLLLSPQKSIRDQASNLVQYFPEILNPPSDPSPPSPSVPFEDVPVPSSPSPSPASPAPSPSPSSLFLGLKVAEPENEPVQSPQQAFPSQPPQQSPQQPQLPQQTPPSSAPAQQPVQQNYPQQYNQPQAAWSSQQNAHPNMPGHYPQQFTQQYPQQYYQQLNQYPPQYQPNQPQQFYGQAPHGMVPGPQQPYTGQPVYYQSVPHPNPAQVTAQFNLLDLSFDGPSTPALSATSKDQVHSMIEVEPPKPTTTNSFEFVQEDDGFDFIRSTIAQERAKAEVAAAKHYQEVLQKYKSTN